MIGKLLSPCVITLLICEDFEAQLKWQPGGGGDLGGMVIYGLLKKMNDETKSEPLKHHQARGLTKCSQIFNLHMLKFFFSCVNLYFKVNIPNLYGFPW